MLCRSGKSRSFLPLHVPQAPLRIWGCWDPWGTVGENRLLRGQGGRDFPVATCLPQPGCWESGQVRQAVCKGEMPHPRSEASPSLDPIPLSWDFGAWVEGDLGDFSLLTSENVRATRESEGHCSSSVWEGLPVGTQAVGRLTSHAAASSPTWGPEQGHPPQQPHDSPGSRLQMPGG